VSGFPHARVANGLVKGPLAFAAEIVAAVNAAHIEEAIPVILVGGLHTVLLKKEVKGNNSRFNRHRD
jgi:hypothetical protein